MTCIRTEFSACLTESVCSRNLLVSLSPSACLAYACAWKPNRQKADGRGGWQPWGQNQKSGSLAVRYQQTDHSRSSAWCVYQSVSQCLMRCVSFFCVRSHPISLWFCLHESCFFSHKRCKWQSMYMRTKLRRLRICFFQKVKRCVRKSICGSPYWPLKSFAWQRR